MSMTQFIYGDINVKRALTADRRVNEGLSRETLVESRVVTSYDYSWLQFMNASTQNVIFPDATSLAVGWSIVCATDVTSGASVNIKSYDAINPMILTNVVPGAAFRFVLTANTSSAGTWHIESMNGLIPVAATRYVGNFNATTNWSGPAGGYYTLTIPQSTHQRGTNPLVELLLGTSTLEVVSPDQMISALNGDVSILVPSVPDLRFAGQFIFV
jgi:hypothetical protein